MVYVFTILNAVLALIGPYLLGKAIDTAILPQDYSLLVQFCLLLGRHLFAGQRRLLGPGLRDDLRLPAHSV